MVLAFNAVPAAPAALAAPGGATSTWRGTGVSGAAPGPQAVASSPLASTEDQAAKDAAAAPVPPPVKPTVAQGSGSVLQRALSVFQRRGTRVDNEQAATTVDTMRRSKSTETLALRSPPAPSPPPPPPPAAATATTPAAATVPTQASSGFVTSVFSRWTRLRSARPAAPNLFIDVNVDTTSSIEFECRQFSNADALAATSSKNPPHPPKECQPRTMATTMSMPNLQNSLKNGDTQGLTATGTTENILRVRRLEASMVLMGRIAVHPRINAEYQLEGELGVGAFGFVLVARHRFLGTMVAVKFVSRICLNASSLVPDPSNPGGEKIPNEIAVLRRIQHPHIIQYIDSFVDNNFFYIITELHGSQWTPYAVFEHMRHHPYGLQPLFPAGPISAYSRSTQASARSCVGTPTCETSHQPCTMRRSVTCDELHNLGSDKYSPASASSASSTSTASTACAVSISPQLFRKERSLTPSRLSPRMFRARSNAAAFSTNPLPAPIVRLVKRRHRRASLPASMFSDFASPTRHAPEHDQHARLAPMRSMFMTSPTPTTPFDSSRTHARTPSDPSNQLFLPKAYRRTYTHDLFDCIEHYRRLPEALAQYIFVQVLAAVEYLHESNLCHGDIKDENILIDRHFHVRLVDFGACTSLDRTGHLRNFTGTVHYAAPEVLEAQPFNAAVAEIWTLGILVCTMVSGSTPFPNTDMARRGAFTKPRGISSSCTDLITRCLQPNPANRITLAMLKNHPWVLAGNASPHCL